MPKIYKRIFTPLFFLVLVLTCLCVSSYAAGEPTISINGAAPVPFDSNVTLVSGDVVNFTTSGTFTQQVTIPAGVTATVPAFVELGVNGVRVEGTVDFYGTITATDPNRATAVSVFGTFNMYNGSVVNANNVENASALAVAEGGVLNIYGGSISSSYRGVNNLANSTVNFYSGSVSAPIPFFASDTVVYPEGRGDLDSETGTITVAPTFFGVIGSFVDGAVTWLGAFADAIIASPLLLIMVLLFLVGLGLGLIKRIIY